MEFARERVIRSLAHDDGLNAWSTTTVRPPADLRHIIDRYSEYSERTGGFSVRRELPHADAVLIINLGAPVRITDGTGRSFEVGAGRVFAAGAHLHPAYSASTGSQAGIHVHLSLEALRQLIGVPMTELRDRALPVDEILGSRWSSHMQTIGDAETLRDRMEAVDAMLLSSLGPSRRIGSKVVDALHLLRTAPALDIADVARDVGWSGKHLANRVEETVGVGPRSFRRLLRFQQLTSAIAVCGKPNWAALAVRAGYSDQPHMIREFREFAEITPGEYARRLLPDGGGLVES